MTKDKPKVSEKVSPDPDVDGGYAWIILGGCFLMYLLTVGTIKAYGVLYTEMVSYYGAGSGNTAWIVSVVLLFMLGMSPFSNMLSRRFSFRKVAMVGGILLGGGYFLSGFCSRMEYMYLTMSLCGGLGYGLSFAPCSTVISYYFNKNRSLANGLTVSGSGIGALVFPFLYRFLINKYSLLGAFWVIGAILSNVCVAACFLRQPKLLVEEKKKLKATTDRSDARKALLNGTDSNISQTEPSFCQRAGIDLKLSLFKNARFSLYCTAFILCMNGYGNNLILIPSQIKAIGCDKLHVVYGVTIMGGCETVARIFFGWLADRKFIQKKNIFVISVFAGAVSCFLAPSFKNFAFMGIHAAITGTFPGSLWSLLPVLIIDVVGLPNFTPAFGLSLMGLAFGVVLSQPVVGWLEDFTGNWNASFYLTGCLLIISGLLVCVEQYLLRFCDLVPEEPKKEISLHLTETKTSLPVKSSHPTETDSSKTYDTDSLLDASETDEKFTSARISRIYRPYESEKHRNGSQKHLAPTCDIINV